MPIDVLKGIRLRPEGRDSYLTSGTPIFPPTTPVSVSAAFTNPSVPAANNFVPSALKHRLLQLPLCRCVRHTVSISPWLVDAAQFGGRGRRFSWTCPDKRPRARRGVVGWRVWVKRSLVRG